MSRKNSFYLSFLFLFLFFVVVVFALDGLDLEKDRLDISVFLRSPPSGHLLSSLVEVRTVAVDSLISLQIIEGFLIFYFRLYIYSLEIVLTGVIFLQSL